MNPDTQNGYQAPQQTPTAGVPQPQPVNQQERNRGLEILVPINRSGWSIAAGYVALFNIPFLITAPFALILGIVGLIDIKKNPSRAGRGRCWFAIIYSGLALAIAIPVLISAYGID